MSAVPDSVGVTPGAGKNVAVYDFTEAATGKVLQRVALSDPLGNPLTVGAPSTATLLTPTVSTGQAYGNNFVVGGLLHFAGVFGSTGSGMVRTARLTCNKTQLNSFTLFLFNANPTTSAAGLANGVVANLNAADAAKVLMAIQLTPNSQLGAHTIAAASVETVVDVNATDLYGVVVIDGPLTNEFTTTTDIVVELVTTADIGP